MSDMFSRVNIPNTMEWCKFNDNSKAGGFRQMFTKKYGGEFKHNGKWHQWIPPNDITLQPPNTMMRPNQAQVHFSNKQDVVEQPEIEYDPKEAFKSRVTVDLEKKSEFKQKSLYIIMDPEGNETEIENFSKFCRDHNLNKSAMYEVARGKRKHHKKYTCRKKEY